ncbi:hypothetical protein SEA_APOCALYPSE_72 [Mycobacterium phage Apocalypse]|uniref:Uncharacterized protein n=1 Tax=Mycobacterium phage Apocalypse TaxID=2027890 RepID=A0A249XLZ7_9CAUD|nr:hypothetical protein I5G93_gp32 [Mycobacterium phage Apocalypse]ASZ72725.1 hypothetical protein SEA_APOCALYPSE_72 [Mycobacterium phage Apocalypse]
MLRWPSQSTAAANGTDSRQNPCPAAQMAQIGTDSKNELVPALPQVNTPNGALGTDGTDFYGLTSRVEIRGVFPGRVAPSAWCEAHMQKSVPSVPDLCRANSETRPAVAGAWRGADRRR